jgi:ubiquinone/menaquinone biosynthesis C-methylase UbiE
MKSERIFSADGAYAFVVEHNMLAHREAVDIGKRIMRAWLAKKRGNDAVKVLDLAGGGAPITIASIIAAFSTISFEYTNIDVNPDQIRRAKKYSFSPNVTECHFVEGNAWDLGDCGVEDNFDLVYSGLNFHHATPEELYFLGLQLQKVMSTDGVLLNHDLYRPVRYPYLRRPDCNVQNPAESYRLVSDGQLATIAIPDFKIVESKADWQSHAHWRTALVGHDMTALLAQYHTDPESIGDIVNHMYERDYPVSTRECHAILSKAGYDVIVHDFHKTAHPLKDYLAVIEARKV